jgi:hypothetical protein
VLRQLVLLLELVQRRRVQEIALKPHVLSALLVTRPARRAWWSLWAVGTVGAAAASRAVL